ncbi:MAG: hypothetical protein QOD52_2861 [Gaiellaceae bacterium]|jgi:hypothetical protein|nr:hypothetical protein [Gaiellaceae bacterium]
MILYQRIPAYRVYILRDGHGRTQADARARLPLATPAVGPSGDLLVADWGRGVIYAIRKP